MSPATFRATNWHNNTFPAIYRDRILPITAVSGWEQLIALQGVKDSHPKAIAWVRCENVGLCEEPHLRSTCCDSPITTHHIEGQTSYRQCSYCLTADQGKPIDPES